MGEKANQTPSGIYPNHRVEITATSLQWWTTGGYRITHCLFGDGEIRMNVTFKNPIQV